MLGRPHVVVNCRGKLVGRGVEAYWTVRRWRDPTRRLGIRGLSEWRPDCGGEWGVVDSPRLIVTLAARASIARGLPLSRLRHRRRAGEGCAGARPPRAHPPGRAPHGPRSATAATVLVAGRARRANSPSTTRMAVSSPSSRAAVSLAAMRSAVGLNAPP